MLLWQPDSLEPGSCLTFITSTIHAPILCGPSVSPDPPRPVSLFLLFLLAPTPVCTGLSAILASRRLLQNRCERRIVNSQAPLGRGQPILPSLPFDNAGESDLAYPNDKL